MPRQLKPCGTPAAYQRHKRNGEPIDDACRDARNAYTSAQKNAVGYNRARSRALNRLMQAHKEEFRTYYTEELAKEALGGDGGERP